MIPLTKARYYLSDLGIQQKTSELLITSRELQIAQNVHYFETGSWTKRNGYIKRYTNVITGTPILTGLYELVKRNGTKTFLSTCDKLYKGVQGDDDAVEVTGGLTFTTGLNGENLMSFVTFNNKVIGTNGVEAVWQFDGTTASTLAGSPPIAPVMAIYENFVFLAGNSTNPYRLYFSNDGDETTWDAADYIDIGDLTNPITGLAVLFGKLYIFTRRAMYELRGFDRDTFTVSEVTLSTGCVSPRSVVKVDNNLLFWSDRGLYSFDGINVHYLSENLQIKITELNFTRTPYIVAELYKARNQVWFAISTGSNAQNNEVICVTYKPTQAEDAGITSESVAFAIYTGISANCFGLERSDTELDRLYSGSYTGLVFKQDSGTNDNGTGIDFKVKTPPIDMGEPETFKRFRYMYIFMKQGGAYNLGVSYISDFGVGGTSINISQFTNASLWGVMVWNPDEWATGISYSTAEWLKHNGLYYKCLINHTSGDFDIDLANGKWVLANINTKWGGSTIIESRVAFKAQGHYLELTFSNPNADEPVTIKGFTIFSALKGLRH